MDIWGWVRELYWELYDEGHEHLAKIMYSTANLVVDGKFDEADAQIDEGLSLAKELNLSWVELFLKHWKVQSKVLHQHEPKNMLKEAIALLEFSHREENMECPQRICAVQDLANCYAQLDGPGYAEERINVAQEGLEQITVRWDCYGCICTEYAGALVDSQRYNQAIEFINDANHKLELDGQGKNTGELLLIEVDAYVAQSDYKKASILLKQAKSGGGGNQFKVQVKVYKQWLHAKTKKYHYIESIP